MKAAVWVLAAGLAGSAMPVAAEVVSTSDDGFVTRDTATVPASPLDTWLALIKPADWWNDDHTWSADASNMKITPQAGGCFCEAIPGDDGSGNFAMDGSVQHATVLQAYPMRVLRMRGGLGPLQGEPATGILTVTLKEEGDGTRILWEYNVGGPMRYEIDQISVAVDGVMSQQLAGLAKHLGGASDEAAPKEEDTDENEEEVSVEDEIDAMAESSD